MKKSKSSKEWMSFAESDLELASKGKFSKKIMYETLCFHTQQAAEKSIKEILIFHKIDFPKTHNIKHLLDLAANAGITIPSSIKKSDMLTDFAAESRYPGDYYPVEKGEYQEALKLAATVLKWAKSIIEKKHDKLF